MNETYILHVVSHFSAAHALRDFAGPCANVHGHNYKIQADVCTKVPDAESGMVVDFYKIKKALENVLEPFNYNDINKVAPFDRINSTNENMAKYFFEQLSKLVNSELATVKSISVWEDEVAGATYSKL